jgi:diguanylate cyclase (GGDEF)-like protein
VATTIDEQKTLIDQLMAENAALRRRLPRDADTGLFSRPHFDERLSYEWRRAQATWTALSLVYIDVSAWAPEPPSSGRREPFTVPEMRRIALLLDDACRDIDVPCRVSRHGFAIILPNTNRTGAEAESKRLREALDDEALGIGMAVAVDEAQSPLELLLLAEDDAERDRRRSLLPGAELALDDPFAAEEFSDPMFIPTESELPVFADDELPLSEDDEDAIPTIPAARPSWVAA